MNLESSFRKRAFRARVLSRLYVAAALAVFVIGIVGVLQFANKVLVWQERVSYSEAVSRFAGVVLLPASDIASKQSQDSGISASTLFILASGMIVLIVCAAGFFLLRMSFQESFLGVRFDALGDALCLSRDSLSDFEKAASIIVPRDKNMVRSDLFSTDEIKAITDIVKSVRG